MKVTYIGLSEYFQRCIPKAKSEGYVLIISLIARYSDAQELYEKLEKDWASLNDLTGDKILFIFSTPKVRKRASFFHMPGKRSYDGVICPFVELLNDRGVGDNNGPFEYRYGDYKKINWKQRHSQTITEFATKYNISEEEIPCLFLYDLIGNRHKIIPVERSASIYVMIKAMIEKIAECRNKRENIEEQLEFNDIWDNLENVMKEGEKRGNSKLTILQDILTACVKLQSNTMYFTASEDQRNDYIRDLLKTAKYDVMDQTRRGASAAGKCAGEVDILIEEYGLPVTIIEALNLTYLNTSYLDKHIDKIFSYDASGNVFNIVLSYVKVADFSKFCKKYFKHIKDHQYLYPLISADDNFKVENIPFSDIRVMRTAHRRNGNDTSLYHICVLIGK